jgi:hypothetical protein
MKASNTFIKTFVLILLLTVGSFQLLAEYDSDGVDLVGRYPYGYCPTAYAFDDYVCIGNGTVVEILNVHTMQQMSELLTESVVSTIYVDSTFAYIANWSDGLKVVDISDVSNPIVVDSISFPGQCWDVSVFGDFAYVGNDIDGLRIVDITDPNNISLVSTFLPALESGFEYTQVVGSIAYAASKIGLYILDVADPSNPIELGFSPSNYGSWHVHVVDSIAYLPEFDAGIRVVNVSDPANPIDLGNILTPGPAYWMGSIGTHAYVAELWGGVEIFDITDASAPVSLGTHDGYADAFHIKGDTIYIATSNYGLEMWDISSSPNFVYIGEYGTGSYSGEIYYAGGYAYASLAEKGIGVFNITTPNDPVLLTTIEIEAPRAIHGSGNYVYAITGGDIQIIDVSTPETPQIINTIYGLTAYSIFSVGNLLYIGGYPDLTIWDVSDPMNPFEMGNVDGLPGGPGSTFVSGSYAYQANRYGGFFVINIQDPYAPYLVGENLEFDYAFAVGVSGNFAYVADRYLGLLKILDISDPVNPFLISSFEVGIQARDVFASGRYAYVISPWDGVRIIDCGNPYNPQEVGYFNTGGYAQSVYGEAGDLWVSDGGGGIYALQTEFHQAVFEAPSLTTSTSSLDFGPVYVSYADTLILEFSNIGDATIDVSNLSSDNTAYTVDLTSFQVGAGERQIVNVSFAPTGVGPFVGELTFLSSDPLLPADTLSLVGHGILPPDISLSVDSLSHAIFSGNSSMESFTISNAGDSDLNYEIAEVLDMGNGTTSFSEGRLKLLEDNASAQRISFSGKDNLIPQIVDQGQPTVDTELSDSGKENLNTTVVPQSWELLITDPDENFVNVDIQYVYGTTTSEELLFKIESYQPWSYSSDVFFYVLIDADQDSSTGTDFDDNILGIDNAIINFPGENNMTGVLAWDEFSNDFLKIGELSTLVIEDNTQTAIIGGSLELLQNPKAINFLVYLNETNNEGSDLAPDDSFAVYVLGIPWITAIPPIGTIPAGENEEIVVTYDAEGMIGGDYRGSLLISSNDPDMPEIDVPVHLDVTGAPNILVAVDTLDFGEAFLDVPHTLPLEVFNNGSDDLLIFSTVIDPIEFGVSPAYAGVDPGDKEVFSITFTPPSLGSYSGSLTFNSNDPDDGAHILYLMGTGVEAPIFIHDPDTFYAELFTNESEIQTLTFSNTGGSELFWEIELDGIGAGTVMFAKEDYVDWTLPENQDRITEKVWITRADDQGLFNIKSESDYNYDSPRDTEWSYGLSADLEPSDYSVWRDAVYPPPSQVGQPLSLHLISEDKYYDLMFHSWTSMGGGGFSYTRTDVEPQWLFLSESAGTLPVDSTTNLELTFDATDMFGGDYHGDLIVRTNDPFASEEHIPLHLNVTGIPDIEYALSVYEETSLIHWFEYNAVTEHHLSPHFNFHATEDALLTVGVDGDFNSTSEYADIYIEDAFVGTINPTTNNFSTQEFLIPAEDLNRYLYDGVLIVSVANSPNVGVGSGNDFHQVSISYTGGQDSLDYGEVFIGNDTYRNIIISNTGTDSLRLNSVTSDNSAFTISTPKHAISYNETDTLRISFVASEVATYSGLITIDSDDPDEGLLEIPVRGYGIEPPVIQVAPDQLSVELNYGETNTQYVTISNTGASSLNYHVVVDDHSQAVNDQYGLELNGIDGSVNINNSESLNPVDGITVSMWLYLSEDPDCDGNNNYRSILYKGWTCCVHDGYDIMMEDDRSISWDVGTAGNPMRYLSSVFLPIGEWTFLTCTYDAQTSQAKMYFNGVEVPADHGYGEHGSGSILPNYSSLNFSYSAYEECPSYGSGTFPGIYDEVRLWNYARSQEDIQAGMNAELTGDEEGLAGYWPLNEGTGTEVLDMSPNGNHGYFNGGVRWIRSDAPIMRWLMIPVSTGVVQAGADLALAVDFNALVNLDDRYEANIVIEHNDPTQAEIVVPVLMEIAAVSVADDVALPTQFMLYQNYPNPFNPYTNIKYGLPDEAEVSVILYDINGREINTLIAGRQTAGWYQIRWNGTDMHGDPASSGLYFCRIVAGDYKKTIKMVYLK